MRKEARMADLREKTENKITTYMERSLHAYLKAYFCPDESCHELKIGRYVADACDGGTIFEIQTGNFSPLVKKIKFYLENTDFDIVVVRPIAKNRRIFWLDPVSGEMNKPSRPSPKHEGLPHGIADLFYVREFLGEKRLSFCCVLMDVNEVRLLDGYGKDKKKRATSVDRLAGEIHSLTYIRSLDDVREHILPLLPDGAFSRDELAKHLKIGGGLKLWSAQKLLVETGLLSCEKDGKRLVFEKC